MNFDGTTDDALGQRVVVFKIVHRVLRVLCVSCMFRLVVSFTGWSRAVGKWAEARAVGNAQRCPRQAGRFERQLELSTCPPPPPPRPQFSIGAPNLFASGAMQLVTQRLVNAPVSSLPLV